METPRFLDDFEEQSKMDPYADNDDGDKDLDFEMEEITHRVWPKRFLY